MKTSDLPPNSKTASELITIEIGASTDEALSKMKTHAVHHLLVVEQGALRGIISDRELLHAPSSGTVGQLLRQPMPTIDDRTDIAQVLKLMVENDVDAAVVMREGKATGLVTKIDLLRVLNQVHHGISTPSLITQSETMASNPMVQSFLTALSTLGV